MLIILIGLCTAAILLLIYIAVKLWKFFQETPDADLSDNQFHVFYRELQTEQQSTKLKAKSASNGK